MTHLRKKLARLLLTSLLVGLTILCIVRWNVWFHNPEEKAYTAPAQPSRVLLTFGDRYETSRNVSWQCDSVVRPSWLELVCLGDSTPSDTTRVEAQGEVFRSRSGVAAYYVARLRHLQPGAHYTYRVVTDGKSSDWYDFSIKSKTSNLKLQTSNFLYVGDVQDTLQGEANRFLREALQRHPSTEFLVCGGDLTERPIDAYWGETFRDIDSVAQHLPVLTVTGNHDYLKGVVRRLERRFSLVFSYFLDSKVDDNQVYTLCYGPVQLFLLDSNREPNHLWTQRQWLERELSQSQAQWKIVVLHHPIYSLMGSMNNLFQRWLFNDLIERYGVDLVMQGHEHAYARMTRHDDDGRAVTPVYTVSHCSPKNYRIKFDDRFDKFGISSRYYQTVQISGDTLSLAAYEVYHHTLYDSLQIIKKGDAISITDLGTSIPEYMEYTPRPGNKKDQAFARRVADYRERHPERLK